MSLLTVLTVIFVVLKVVGVIDWSWWLVLAPTLFSIGVYLVFFIVWVLSALVLIFKK